MLDDFIALETSKIAENWGYPTPATTLVVHIDPGPIPTLIASTPSLDKNLAASAVAIFPAHRVVFFDFNFYLHPITYKKSNSNFFYNTIDYSIFSNLLY